MLINTFSIQVQAIPLQELPRRCRRRLPNILAARGQHHRNHRRRHPTTHEQRHHTHDDDRPIHHNEPEPLRSQGENEFFEFPSCLLFFSFPPDIYNRCIEKHV